MLFCTETAVYSDFVAPFHFFHSLQALGHFQKAEECKYKLIYFATQYSLQAVSFCFHSVSTLHRLKF